MTGTKTRACRGCLLSASTQALVRGCLGGWLGRCPQWRGFGFDLLGAGLHSQPSYLAWTIGHSDPIFFDLLGVGLRSQPS
jgi:hypothetical protein